MILSPDQHATAKQVIAAHAPGLTDPGAIAAALNTPSPVPNPAPQAQIPKPLAPADFMGALAVSLPKIEALPYLPAILDAIDAQNRSAVVLWIAFLASAGTITPAEHDALLALDGATEPDPAWQATVAGPSPWQEAFPDVVFALPDGSKVAHQCNPAIIAEALT